MALGFVALAFALRLPALLYSVLNFDESMYLLMGDQLRQGFLPYTTLCDLKPVGLFALFAAISALPMDGVVAMRLVGSIVVGLGAFLLWLLAGRLFEDGERRIGTAAGLAYVVFMLTAGGLNTQSELFLDLLTMAGLLLGFLLLTTPRAGRVGAHLRESWPALALLAAMAAAPTLLVILVYAMSGHLGAWIAGNVTAHRAFYGEGVGPEIAWDAGFRAVIEQAPLWTAAGLGALLSPWLTADGRERRVVLFLVLWVALIALGQVFLRFMADHYFLQFLPPLCLLGAFLLDRAVLRHVGRPLARRALLAALVGITVFAVAKNPYVNAFYVAKDRYLLGQAFAGDAARQVAADLAPDLREGDAVYVFGFMPIVYYLTGARIPTRFAFTGLPNQRFPGRDGCPWVEPRVELERVLDSRPRFVVLERGVFLEELPQELKDLLLGRLARDYHLRASFERHPIHPAYPFERFVMNGATEAGLYELMDEPGDAPAPASS
jgi:hypothetical protein